MKVKNIKKKQENIGQNCFFDKIHIFPFVPLFKEEDYIYKKTKYKFQCKKYGNIFEDNFFAQTIPRCLKCFPLLKGTSKIEQEIQNWLENLIKIEKNKRFFYKKKRFELDVFAPSKNIGIELNGLYWHSEVSGNKDRNYHLGKTKFFKNQGIQIIHIFEDEWIEKQEIIKSIILSKLGLIQNKIFAQKCQIKEISSKEAKLFLFDNHIQGETNSKINIGLFHENILLSLMTFGKPKFNKNYNWEMTRFCNKINYSVVGGASKMLSYFKKNNIGKIISYADLRFSTEELYEKLGFNCLHQTSPNYFYLTNNFHRVHRIQFQKHKLKDKLKFFDPNLTEWQNMQLNNYDRIWDCGNLVFSFH